MARPRGNRKTARISVSLDAQDYAMISEIAREQDVSVAWVVRRAVSEMVRNHQEGAEQPKLPLAAKAVLPTKVGSR